MRASSMNAPAAGSSSTAETASAHRYPWKWWLKDLPDPGDGAPTVFSTFACGGGSSMGYKRAGYRVLGNCEIDPRIAKVYKANLHPKLSYVMDIREFNALESLPDELYELDVLDGSPPCSTFSMCGSREKAWGVEKRFAEGQAMQRLDDLFFTYLDTVEKLRPKVFVAENVVGLIQGNARGYVSEIAKKAKGIGYDVQLFKLNAAFMGCPQLRERVFFVGNRMGYDKLSLTFDEPVVTFGEIRTPTGRAMRPGSTTAERLKHMRRGDYGIDAITKRTEGKRLSFNTRILWDDRPVDTLTSRGACVRACDKTWASNDDFRNMQTFPQDYDFGDAQVAFICGMSVPPSMMANIAHEIRGQWLGK